jgi:hypothetical protein
MLLHQRDAFYIYQRIYITTSNTYQYILLLMKIAQFKSALQLAKPAASPVFLQTSGISIAAHYHITEIGLVLKNYVDCGGVVRQERKATMQIWLASDRSSPKHSKIVGNN